MKFQKPTVDMLLKLNIIMFLALITFSVVGLFARKDPDQPEIAGSLVLPRIKCIEICLAYTNPANDELGNSIRKCEIIFSEQECRLSP